MAQQQFTERPYKVLAELYRVGAVPPAAGVCTIAHDPFPNGEPHVHVQDRGPYALHGGEVIVMSLYDVGMVIDVQTEAEFEDRFGPIAVAQGG